MLLLVPADPLDPRRPDEHFAPDASAARSSGAAVAIVDDDLLRQGDPDGAVKRVPHGSGEGVFRGWMLRSREYANLAAALRTHGVELRTSPEMYARAHELPGWYAHFEELTATSAWLTTVGTDGLADALGQLPSGAAVIKDYVKSEKHYWSEAAFVPDVEDVEGATAVASRFIELRGADIVGGVVVRAFERYCGPEIRTWWIGGRHVLSTPHPDTPDAAVPDVDTTHVESAVAALDCRFITVDLALREDGAWRVIEVGDGQVSDLPEGQDPAPLIQSLIAAS